MSVCCPRLPCIITLASSRESVKHRSGVCLFARLSHRAAAAPPEQRRGQRTFRFLFPTSATLVLPQTGIQRVHLCVADLPQSRRRWRRWRRGARLAPGRVGAHVAAGGGSRGGGRRRRRRSVGVPAGTRGRARLPRPPGRAGAAAARLGAGHDAGRRGLLHQPHRKDHQLVRPEAL